VKRQVLAILEALGVVAQPETLDRNPIDPSGEAYKQLNQNRREANRGS